MEKLQKLLVHAAKHGPLELGGFDDAQALSVALVFFLQNSFNTLH